jgi:hypothetical protein
MSQSLSFEFMLDDAEQVRVGNLVNRRSRFARWWRWFGVPSSWRCP